MRIPATTSSARTLQLIDQARAANVIAVARALQLGAKVVQLAEPDQFAAVYAPYMKPKGILVSLPGTASHALVAASHWIEHCKRNSFALATIQWWDGADTYLTPAEISDVASKLLSFCQADKLPRIVHGHSRGATQLYRLMGPAGGEHLPARGYLVECGSLESSWAPSPAAQGQRVVLVAGRGDTKVPLRSMETSQTELAARGAITQLQTVGFGSPMDHGALTREPTSVDAAFSFLLG